VFNLNLLWIRNGSKQAVRRSCRRGQRRHRRSRMAMSACRGCCPLRWT
jgi:hypothetical protein